MFFLQSIAMLQQFHAQILRITLFCSQRTWRVLILSIALEHRTYNTGKLVKWLRKRGSKPKVRDHRGRVGVKRKRFSSIHTLNLHVQHLQRHGKQIRHPFKSLCSTERSKMGNPLLPMYLTSLSIHTVRHKRTLITTAA